MRLAHFGTFDVENYGDLLYPLVARRRLEALGADMVFVSPVGGPPVFADCVATVHPDALEGQQVDGVLLGGGNIVHAGLAGVDDYRQDPLTWLLAYPRLWLDSARLAAERSVPLCWNAPGVPGAFSPRIAGQLRAAAASAAYLSVRDHGSLRRLRDAGVTQPVEIVADPGFDVVDLFPSDRLDDEWIRLFGERGRQVPERTVAVHLNRRYLGGTAEETARNLDRLAEASGAVLVLLPLGRCHDDHETARAIDAHMAADRVVVDRVGSLAELVAALGRADGYVGSSLHGMITALAFGRPGLLVDPQRGASQAKFAGLLSQFHLRERLLAGWDDAAGMAAALAPDPAAARAAVSAREQLDHHWERIAAALRGGQPHEPAQLVLAEAVVLEEAAKEVAALALRERTRAEREREAARALSARVTRAEQTAVDERGASAEALAAAEEARRAEQEARQAAEDAAQAADEERRRADAALAARDDLAERLRAAVDEAEQRVNAAVERATTAEHEAAEAATVRRERDDLLAAAAAADRERERLSALVAQANGHVEEITQLRASLQERDADLAAARAELVALRAETAEQVARLETLRQDLEHDLQEARRSADDGVGELERAHERHARAGAELAAQRREAARLASEHERLTTALKQAKSQSASHATLSAERKVKIERLERDLRDARSALAAQVRAIERTRGELTGLDDTASRIAQSRSWRVGHRIMRTLRVLTFRPPKGEGAMPRLVGQAERAIGALEAERPTPPVVSTPQRPSGASNGRPQTPVAEPPAIEGRTAAIDELRRTLSATPEPVPPVDARGILRSQPSSEEGSVDVVVCVHNALSDVHRCVTSILERSGLPLRLIVVDDGSDEETAGYLDRFVARNPAVELHRRSAPPHGYTLAANTGLRASTADFVVLLNSDTVVTRGWLEHLVEAGRASERTGIIGPLSNAASHQSVPRARDGVDWAVNELPAWMTEDTMGLLVSQLPGDETVEVPFLNGFCYCIRRATIDAIGVFDEEHFAAGYSEENDYSRRAAEAGFDLVVAARAYVFHAKSRSYGHAGRRELAKRHYQVFLERHGEDRIRELVEQIQTNPSLTAVRDRVATAVAAPADALRWLPRLNVSYVLPGMAVGGSGGSHSIYQEVAALRALGLEARILIAAAAWTRALEAYPDGGELFVPYADTQELARLTTTDDVIVATHFTSVPAVRELVADRRDCVAAYYVQDFEPLFAPAGSEAALAAERSYSEISDCLLFAKTEWLQQTLAERLGLPVAKVEPSIDADVFHTRGRREEDDVIHIAAMIRPRTPRRAPAETLEVLRRVLAEHGDRVRVTTFGCPPHELRRFGGPDRRIEHRGILGRGGVAELLRSTDVFVDCSWYQAFGRTSLEAMACGATTVAPQLGGATEFAVHGRNALLADTGDVDTVVGELRRLIEEPGLLAQLKREAAVTGARYNTVRAAISEYTLFCCAHLGRHHPAATEAASR